MAAGLALAGAVTGDADAADAADAGRRHGEFTKEAF